MKIATINGGRPSSLIIMSDQTLTCNKNARNVTTLEQKEERKQNVLQNRFDTFLFYLNFLKRVRSEFDHPQLSNNINIKS